MFNKNVYKFTLASILTLSFFSFTPIYYVYADGPEATAIAQNIGVTPGSWTSRTTETMSVIDNGLLQINSQAQVLADKGVSPAAIAAQRAESISALQDYAKATNANENWHFSDLYTKASDLVTGEDQQALKAANAAKAQSNFIDTLALGYKKAGLTAEADAMHGLTASLDKSANANYAKSLPDATAPGNTFANNSALAGLNPQGKVYTLLAPIETFFPGGTIDIAGKGLSGYLDGLYKAGIAIATGLALIMIVIGGLQYVSTDAIGGKSEGRQRINNAIIGLLLALGSYILLQQINPALLKNDFNVEATKSTGKVNSVSIELSSGTTAPPPDIREGVDVSQMPYTQSLLNNVNYSITGAPQAQYSSTPGSRVIGGGVVYIDYDGSPGAYKVAVAYPGKYTFRGVQYNSVGYEDLANAGLPGNWWGVKTDTGKTSGQPIINADGTLIPILSIGAGVINGDVTPFVALSKEQVAAAKSKYGVSLTPNINTKVILTANGKSVYATYADYAGSRALNYSEISPAAAKALGIDFGKRNGKSYAVGNVTISLP